MKKTTTFIILFSLLSACNMPRPTPEFTAPTEFIQILSPNDGAILSSVPFDFRVRVWRLRADVSSIEVKQLYDANEYIYGPFSANSSLQDQTIAIPNVPITPEERLLGIITYVAIANLTDGSKLESSPITVCLSSLDRTNSSYFYDFGTFVGNATICIPTILPDSGDNNTRIVIDGVIQFNGNRCLPFHNNRNAESYAGGVLISMFAQTYRTDLISKVTADVNFRDDAFALSYSGGEEEFFNPGANIWTGYHGLSYPSADTVDPNYYALPNNFNRIEVMFKAYNLENQIAATDIATLDFPPCAQGGGDQVTETPTLIPTVDFKPSDSTKTPKPDNEEEEKPEPTSCPPTISCGP